MRDAPMTESEEIAERIIRKGFVRPLLQQAEQCVQENDDCDESLSYWLAMVTACSFGDQLPRHTDYREVAAIILDCLDVPEFV